MGEEKMSKKKEIALDIMCLDDGEIYLGEVKETKSGKARSFYKDRKIKVTKEVLNAVVNYMSLHIREEDVPIYSLDVTDSTDNQKAVLSFRILRDDKDVMYK